MTGPTDPTISRIVEVLQDNADSLLCKDAWDLDCLTHEAEEWAKLGFTPEEVADWCFYGYEGLTHLAKVLRDAGITPVQGGCAMEDLGDHLRPGFGWADEEEKFLDRALRYGNCCPERSTTRPA